MRTCSSVWLISKGHELTGFGGAIKNIGMGCGSRRRKRSSTVIAKAVLISVTCRGAASGVWKSVPTTLWYLIQSTRRWRSIRKIVWAAAVAWGSCNFDAISFEGDAAVEQLNYRMAEYAKAVVDGRPCFHISLVVDVSPTVTVMGKMTCLFCLIWVCLHPFDPVALDQACADAPVLKKLTASEGAIWPTTWINRTLLTTMTTSSIPRPNPNGVPVWSTRRKESVWVRGITSWL